MGLGSYSYEVISSVFNEDAFEQGVVITFVLNTGTSIFMDPMSRARQTLSTMRSCPTSSGLLLRQSIRASTAGPWTPR